MSDDTSAIFTTKFPMYCVRCIGERHILVAGGGGQAKTGVPNCLEVFLFNINGGSWDFCKVAVVNTGLEATMNMDVLSIDEKTGSFYVACGQGGSCAIYETSYNIARLINDELIDEKSAELSNDANVIKKLSLSFRSVGQPFQTDFPSTTVVDKKRSTGGPFQKAVKFNSNGDWLVTGGTDGIVRVWNRTICKTPAMDASAYCLLAEHQAHQDDVDDVDINRDCTKFVTVGRDGSGSVWSYNSSDGFSSLTPGATIGRSNGGISADSQSPFVKTVDLADKKYGVLPAKYRFRFSRFCGLVDENRECLITVSVPVVRTSSKKQCCYATRWLLSGKPGAALKCQTKEHAALDLRNEIASALAVRVDGLFLAVGTLGGSLAVVDTRTLRVLRFFSRAHEIFVTSLDFVPPAARSTPQAAFCPLLTKFSSHGVKIDSQSSSPSLIVSVSADNSSRLHVVVHDDNGDTPSAPKWSRRCQSGSWGFLQTLIIWLLMYYAIIFLGF